MSFEQRRFARIQPLPGEVIAVRISSEAGADVGLMRDLSSDGMSVEVAGPTRCNPHADAAMELLFSLPGTPPISADGIVRHRREAGAALFLGLQFLNPGERASRLVAAYLSR